MTSRIDARSTQTPGPGRAASSPMEARPHARAPRAAASEGATFRARLAAERPKRTEAGGLGEGPSGPSLEASLLAARLRADVVTRAAQPAARTPGEAGGAHAAAVWSGLERLQVGHDRRGSDHVRIVVRGRGGAAIEATLERAAGGVAVAVASGDARAAEGLASAIRRELEGAGVRGEVSVDG